MNKLDEAVAWYRKALELDPRDEDARYNMEFVRQEMERRKNQTQEDQEKKETGEDKRDKNDTGEQRKPGDSGGHDKPKDSGGGKPEGDDSGTHPQEDTEKKGEGAEDQRMAQPHEDPNGTGHTMQGDARSQGEDTEGQGTPAFGMRLNPGEAERLLQAIQEERGTPSEKKEGADMKPYTPEKDW
jgi:Ca-activated chloride channel family protein